MEVLPNRFPKISEWEDDSAKSTILVCDAMWLDLSVPNPSHTYSNAIISLSLLAFSDTQNLRTRHGDTR